MAAGPFQPAAKDGSVSSSDRMLHYPFPAPLLLPGMGSGAPPLLPGMLLLLPAVSTRSSGRLRPAAAQQTALRQEPAGRAGHGGERNTQERTQRAAEKERNKHGKKHRKQQSSREGTAGAGSDQRRGKTSPALSERTGDGQKRSRTPRGEPGAGKWIGDGGNGLGTAPRETRGSHSGHRALK